MASFGFSRDNLNSNSILIPIAYYIKTIGNPVNFVDSKKYASDREKIKKWIVASLLRRVFSSQPDGILRIQVVLFHWKRLLTDSKEQTEILNLQMILLRICCGQNMAAVMHWWFYRYCILGQI